ncbi:MAG: hypothetical protein ACI84K_001651 [Pseudohongiellaceae bacterium]|jgi:hypothetical protein
MSFNSLNKQTGASTPLVIVFLGMAAVVLTLAFKLYSPIFENWQVESVVESFEDDTDVTELSVDAIRKQFNNRLEVNNVRNFNSNEWLFITKDDGLLIIAVDYEVRVPVYRNIDAIMTFEKTLEKKF